MRPGRLEAFSDCVFSIAATLLVLDLKAPTIEVGASLGAALLVQWPSYVTFVVSFLTIGIIWVNHHGLIARVRAVDRTLLFVNLLLLLVVSAVPFPTAVLGRYVLAPEGSEVAAAFYGCVMALMSATFSLVWLYVVRLERRQQPRPEQLRLEQRRQWVENVTFSTGLVAYLAGVGLALISPPASLALYALVAVFYMFPWLREPG